MNFKKTLAAYKTGANDVDVTFTDELERTGEVAPDSQAQDIEFEDDNGRLIVRTCAIVEPAIESGDEDNPYPSRNAKWKDLEVTIDKATGVGQVEDASYG